MVFDHICSNWLIMTRLSLPPMVGEMYARDAREVHARNCMGAGGNTQRKQSSIDISILTLTLYIKFQKRHFASLVG